MPVAPPPAGPASTAAVPTPAAREDRRLLIRYHRHGDGRAREELVVRFMPLARRVARRYERDPESLDDLVQVASVGLVKAIDRFDVERATAFSSYAVPYMVGELKRYFRDFGWAIHVPRGVQERTLDVQATVTRVSKELGRSPSAAEIAAELDLAEEEVLEALEAALAYDLLSLDAARPAARIPTTRPAATRSARRTAASSSSTSGRPSRPRCAAFPSATDGSCECASSRT